MEQYQPNTISETIQRWIEEINNMSHEDMVRFYRFADAGHFVFMTPETYNAFQKRLAGFGGITAEMSRKVGWDNNVVFGNPCEPIVDFLEASAKTYADELKINRDGSSAEEDESDLPWKSPAELLGELEYSLERHWNGHYSDIRNAFAPYVEEIYIRIKDSSL